MPTSIRITPNSALRALFAALLLTIGAIVFVGAWLAIATLSQGRAGWMALVAALIAIVPLRLTRMRSGIPRALLAMCAAAASIMLGEWLVAALPIALATGRFPLETAQRIGPDFGWMLVSLGNTPLDWLWVAIALVLAGWFGR